MNRLHRLARHIVLLIALIAQSTAVSALTPTVRGLEPHLEDNVLAHIGELDPIELNNTTRLFRHLDVAIDNALQPFGYYSSTASYSVAGESLDIDVEPGPPVFIEKVDVQVIGEALGEESFQRLIENSGLVVGSQLDHRLYEVLRSGLLALAREDGYFDAQYSSSVLTVNPVARTARPSLHLQSGTRYRFGQLSLVGTIVEEELLLAKARFAEGEYYSRAKLKDYEQYLLDTGYFSSVVLSTHQTDAKNVDITFELSDVETNRIEVGVGVSTNTSFRFRFNHLNPRINSAGHSIESATRFSALEQSLDVKYRIPRVNAFKNFHEFSAGAKNEDVQDTQSTTGSLGVRKFGQLGDSWNWSYGASVEYERFQIGDESRVNALYLLPGTSIDFTTLEEGRDPTRGHYYGLDASASAPALGADVAFARLRGTGKWLYPLGFGSTTVLTRLDLGAILTEDIDLVPASLRFSTGGDNSIRGYDYESLSTEDNAGNLTGSQYLVVGSVELSYLVRPNWRVALFLDAGSAFNGGKEEIYRGAGLGVRWLSPVGQIRVDLATPVGSSEHNGVRLHISMGPPL